MATALAIEGDLHYLSFLPQADGYTLRRDAKGIELGGRLPFRTVPRYFSLARAGGLLHSCRAALIDLLSLADLASCPSHLRIPPAPRSFSLVAKSAQNLLSLT